MRQLPWISDFLHNNEILLDNTLCSPQFVYIIILIGQMHKKDIQVKLCQVFYFKLIPCESSVKFLGHFKNKTNSRNIPIHAHRDIHLHTSSHTKYTEPIPGLTISYAQQSTVCKLQALSQPVRLELGAFSGSIFCPALQKAHGNTCKGAFQLTAGPCSIPEQAKAKEALGSFLNSGQINFSLVSLWKETWSRDVLIFMKDSGESDMWYHLGAILMRGKYCASGTPWQVSYSCI